MEKQNFERFRQILNDEKRELNERINHINSNLEMPMRETIGELSMYDNHPADIGDELFERGKDLSLRDGANLQIERVDRALKKLEEGTYGICDRCGGKIDTDRLTAMPAANLCLKCKGKEEVPDSTPRPIEEAVIRPPYGEFVSHGYDRKFGDGDNDPKFDGEDAWQAVARFGTADSPQDLADPGSEYPNVYDDWDEDLGSVEDVDSIPYYRSADGTVYKNFRSGNQGKGKGSENIADFGNENYD